MTPTHALSARVRSTRAAVLLCALAVALTGAGCGGATNTAPVRRTTDATRRSKAARARLASRPASLSYRSLYSLPAPLRDPASAVLGGGHFVLAGGLDAADSSSAEIALADLHGVLHTATLPLAQHDAQGAQLGGLVYVFGGGSFSELDHIISFDPASGVVSTVGTLPHAQSDVAVTALHGTAYVVGGYDGTNWMDTILAWRPGSGVRVVGHLPVGLRYSSVSAVDGELLIIGGSTPNAASEAIYRFDPATGRVTQIGRLPEPITHAGAATLGSFVYLVGGRGDNLDSQTANVWSIDSRTGAVQRAGRLPEPLSDTGVLSIDGAIVVAGGLSPAGTVAGVGELVPSAREP
jgi:hypothetical protein